MKLLATIKSVEITRTFQHQDGTYGNVYGVTIESGNDTIIAETFRDTESQKRNGIVAGAIGTATLTFNVRPWTDKQGKAHYSQDIKLDRFELANRNISTESAQTPANGATAQPQEEKPAEPAQPAEQPQEASTEGTNLPF